jgi:hypothetical protein
MNILSLINTISSVLTIGLFIYLIFQVKIYTNKLVKESAESNTGNETKEFIDSSKALIKDKSFRIKVFVLCGLILVNILTVLFM